MNNVFISRTTIVALFVVACTLPALFPTAESYSFGAGGCAGGEPAVGTPHLLGDPLTENTNVTNGTLALGNIIVLLDGVALTPGVPASFTVGHNHNLTLSRETGYKGLLFRLGGVGTNALLPFFSDTNVQLNVYCLQEQVSGVTHTSNNVKNLTTINLRYDTPAKNLPLDVTVVIQNSFQISIFYYSGFTLNAASVTSPTSKPVVPTSKPLAQTSKPVASTSKPVVHTSKPVAPTLKPAAPTKKPFAPTRKPSRKPVVHTSKPVAPTRKPVAKPLVRPSKPVAPTIKPRLPTKPTSKPVKPASKPTNLTPVKLKPVPTKQLVAAPTL
jgi:hypothetical protein